MEPGQLLLTTAHLGELVEPVFVYMHFYGVGLNLIQLCGCINVYSCNHLKSVHLHIAMSTKAINFTNIVMPLLGS